MKMCSIKIDSKESEKSIKKFFLGQIEDLISINKGAPYVGASAYAYKQGYLKALKDAKSLLKDSIFVFEEAKK